MFCRGDGWRVPQKTGESLTILDSYHLDSRNIHQKFETVIEQESRQKGSEQTTLVKKDIPSVPRVNEANMTISLNGLQSSIDHSLSFSRAY